MSAKPTPEPLRPVRPTAELFAWLCRGATIPAREPTPRRLERLAEWAACRPAFAPLDLEDETARVKVERAVVDRAVRIVAAGRRWAENGAILVRDTTPWGFESFPTRFTKRDGLDIALLYCLAGIENWRSKHYEDGYRAGYRVLLTLPGAGHPEADALRSILDEHAGAGGYEG